MQLVKLVYYEWEEPESGHIHSHQTSIITCYLIICLLFVFFHQFIIFNFSITHVQHFSFLYELYCHLLVNQLDKTA